MLSDPHEDRRILDAILMVDIVDPATRSRMMASIRANNTKPELVVRSYLHRSGLRFRLQAALPGKPDLVLPKYRVALFVHGCFWHRHKNCRFTTTPTSNVAFWQKKFESNERRDSQVRRELQQLGWRVLVIWSCELDDRRLAALVKKIALSDTRPRSTQRGRRVSTPRGTTA